MRNIKLTLEYDGTNFCGWQWQPKGRTVQDTLQCSLKELLQESPTVIASGRTDAGVHALGQVVNFKTENTLDLNSICLGLNSFLPSDITILQAEEVDEKFHARFDAVKRKYRYVISKRPKAVGRYYSWFCKYDLNLDKIKKASEVLIGEHEFFAFSRANDEELHYLCNLESARWKETEEEIILDICANRFLHNMVRIIVGTMVDVGRGKLAPEEMKNIMETRNRDRAGFTAPPQGLFLVKVYY
ncbi:MAG: tRNA pseudouridine(38-40) synthase TruA [bacterium]